MPSPFDLNASIRFQAKDLDKVQKEIGRISAPKIDIGRGALAGANAEYLQMYKNVKRVRGSLEELGNVVGTAARRFGGISVATGTFLGLARGIKNSVGEAITFEREMVKVAQATDNAISSTETLRKTIMSVGETYGASGVELAKYSRILAQAGFSAKQTQSAIKLLAKADLTGTFGGIGENVEGMIAIMQQFGKQAAKTGNEIQFLEQAYDSISRVSKKYAVESGDIIEAVKKAGGVFANAGGSLEEFIAILTSVRATTRESADVIANGLKTIAVRLQDTDNIKALQKLGIQLEDSKGNFIGVFNAVQQLSMGLKDLDPRSIRFANIVKELGGVYQIGRFITLIKEARLSQEALNDALTASGDINRDVSKQQQTLGFQLDQLTQRFNNLVLEFTKTSSFKEFTGLFMEISDALLNVGETLKDNLPLFKTFFLLLGGRAANYAVKAWAGLSKPVSTRVPVNNPVPAEGFYGAKGMQSGGHVTSRNGSQKSDRDSLKAILQPGEYVLRKKAVETIGVNTLNMMNQGLLKTVDIATQRKAQFSNRTSPQKGYTGTVAQILQKTKLKSLESLYDIDNPADAFIAPAINRTPLRYSDGSRVRYNDLKVQAGGITKQAAAEFSKGGPKAANNFLSSIDLGGYVDNVSNKTFSSSGDIFKLFTSVQGAIAEKIFQKANPSYQKLPNAFGMDMISTDGKFAEIKATSTRMSPYTMIGKALIALARFANPKSGYKNKQKDVIGIPETTFYDTALRLNTGGIVPGSGSGDKIPALLEPGEVVVNKRAAQNVGYDVFNAMNRGSISMLADGTPNNYKFTNQNRQPKKGSEMGASELIGIIKNESAINADKIRAEKNLIILINKTVGEWVKVGSIFENLVGKKPKGQTLGQVSQLKAYTSELGKEKASSVLFEKTATESELKKVKESLSITDVAQVSTSTQTTRAVQENTKVLEEIAKNTAETAKTSTDKTPEKKSEEVKTVSANAKASKEAQASSGTPKGLQDIISSKKDKITPTNKAIAKNIITREAKEAGFSEEEIVKAIQNTPELQDNTAGQGQTRKINLKDSGLLARETQAINDADKKEIEKYKAEQEAAGQISPEKSNKKPYPPEEEKLRKEIMAEAVKLTEGATSSKDPRFENVMDKAKANVLARREQEAKAQSEAKAREEAASTVEVPVGPSSGGSGVPPTPPPSSRKAASEDDGKKKSGKRRKKKSGGAEGTVPPVAEAAAKAESDKELLRIPVTPSVIVGKAPASTPRSTFKQRVEAERAQKMSAMRTSSGGVVQKLANDPFANLSYKSKTSPFVKRLPVDGAQKVIEPPKVITSEMGDYTGATQPFVPTYDPMISPLGSKKTRQKLTKATSQAASVLSAESLKALQETSGLEKNLEPRKSDPKLKAVGTRISSDLLDVIEAETGKQPEQKVRRKTQAVETMLSPGTYQDLMATRKLPKSPKINNTLMDLLVANGVATPMPTETRVPTAGKVQPAVSVTSPQMLKELQKSKVESENRQASGKIISGLLDQYGVKPQQNFDPSWMEGEGNIYKDKTPKTDLRKVARDAKAKELFASGKSQEDVSKWFASEEGKKTIKEDVRALRRSAKFEAGNVRDSGSYAQSSITKEQAEAMPRSTYLRRLAQQFPTFKRLSGMGGGGAGGSGIAAGGADESGKNLAKGLDDATGKAQGFGAALINNPALAALGILAVNSDMFADTIKLVTGANQQQVKAIQDSIAGMTAFYLTFQQLNGLTKDLLPKIDKQGNLLDEAGQLIEIEKDGKKSPVKATGLKGKLARGMNFASSKGLSFGNLAIAGTAAYGVSNAIASYRTQEAQKKQGLISKDLEKVALGGGTSLEELQKRSREAYGLTEKTNRGRTAGILGGIAVGGVGGVAGSALLGATIGSVVPGLGTVIGGGIGAAVGGAAGAFGGVAASDAMYKQATLDEKSINESVKAQYNAAKSSYNFGKVLDKLRSGTLKNDEASKLAASGAIDAANALDATRIASINAASTLKDAEQNTGFFSKYLGIGGKDLEAFRERVSKSEEALAQSREVAKQARTELKDRMGADFGERLGKASTKTAIADLYASVTGQNGIDAVFSDYLDKFEAVTLAASDEPDRAKAAQAAAEARKAEELALLRAIDARDFEVDKIQTAIAVRTAEVQLMQQFNAAMKSVTAQTLNMQDAQSKVSVLRGESGGGFNTERLRDLSQVGDMGAFKNTATALSSLVPGGANIARKATTAASAAEGFRNATTTSGLFTGLNELRKVIKPGVDASKTKIDISAELAKNIPEFSSLDKVIQDQVINKLYESLSEGDLELSQIADIGKVISDSGQKFADVLIAAGENANNFIEQLRGVNAALIEEQNKLSQLRSGSIDIRSRAMERMASVSTLLPSQKTQLEANRESFRRAKDAQMLGDVGLRAGNVGQLGQNLAGINAQIQANKKELANPNLDINRREGLNIANQGLEAQANTLTTVLGRLSDQSDRASDKMEQISRIQVQKELVKNRVESFAFGTTEQKFAMAEQAAGLQQVMRTGNFNVLPDDLKGPVADFMKQLSEANPEGAVGQMFKKIQVDAIRQQQAMGFMNKQDAQAAIDIVQGKDVAAEKKLKEDLAKIAQEELTAQQALINAQREVTTSYLEMVRVIRQGFMNPAAGGQQQLQVVPNAPVMAPNAVPMMQPQNVVAAPGNPVAQAVPSFEPVIASMRTFTETLHKISDSFSNMTMTHTLNIDGQINIAGVNTDSIATQLRDSLGEYIGQIVTEEFNKRNSSFRTA
jgi:TP901 family phage tail tape measure protein